jgi:hypothetical protein
MKMKKRTMMKVKATQMNDVTNDEYSISLVDLIHIWTDVRRLRGRLGSTPSTRTQLKRLWTSPGPVDYGSRFIFLISPS